MGELNNLFKSLLIINQSLTGQAQQTLDKGTNKVAQRGEGTRPGPKSSSGRARTFFLEVIITFMIIKVKYVFLFFGRASQLAEF